MKSIYEEKIWLKFYPTGVPFAVPIPIKAVGAAFDESVKRWKSKTAIRFYGARIRYGDLKDKVDRFASALFDLGVAKGDRIAFLLLNSPEYVISFFAAAKIGAIITPISPAYVSSEIRHQLEDSGAEHIICQDILYEAVKNTGIRFKNVILTSIVESLPKMKKFISRSVFRHVYQKIQDPVPKILTKEGYHFHDLMKKYRPSPPRIEINPEKDILTLSYTGGTTGLPRGVMITHYNVMATLTQFRAFYPTFMDGNETLIAIMPFNQITGQTTVLTNGILSGSTAVIITVPNADDILNSIVTCKVSQLGGTPSIFEILKYYEKTQRVNWKNLKMVCSSTDALHAATADDWKMRTGTVIHDLYGMTETTGLCAGTPQGRGKIGSVGIPLPNTVIAIADPDKNELIPIGEIGEVLVSGPQVALGYWNNPNATNGCVVDIQDVKWWRTGDLGRMDEDGYFYLYDTKRDLIKSEAFRVHAREVEEVLESHPQIKHAAVIGLQDIKAGGAIKAFVVLEPDARGKISEEKIIQYCEGKLEHYKIPKVIESVGELPKTDMGRVSRRELREMEEM